MGSEAYVLNPMMHESRPKRDASTGELTLDLGDITASVSMAKDDMPDMVMRNDTGEAG